MTDIKQLIDEVKSSQEAQETKGPIKIKIGNEEFAFSSPDELSMAVTNVVAAYQAQLAETQRKLAETSASAAASAQAQQGPETGSYVTEDEPVAPFDKNKYIELLRNDPIAAAEYIDSYRLFGGYVDRPADLLRTALARVAEQDRVLAAYQFRSMHPEFPGGEQAVNILENIRRENNLPFTASGLEAAYGIAQARGMLPGPQQYQQFIQAQTAANAEQWKNFFAKELRPQGPPSLGRSQAEVPPDIAAVADSLTPEQIEQIFAKIGGAGGKAT